MSQIETRNGIRPSRAGRNCRDATELVALLAKAGVAPELGNLIQIATSAINVIARDPGIRATWRPRPLSARSGHWTASRANQQSRSPIRRYASFSSFF